jgi:DNA-binding phage protein
MKTVQSLTSRNYHDFLIESLCDLDEISAYIETVLEDGKNEPELLLQVLNNAIEAYNKMNKLSDSTIVKYQHFKEILNNSKGTEIYSFLELLEDLGLSISINAKNQ